VIRTPLREKYIQRVGDREDSQEWHTFSRVRRKAELFSTNQPLEKFARRRDCFRKEEAIAPEEKDPQTPNAWDPKKKNVLIAAYPTKKSLKKAVSNLF